MTTDETPPAAGRDWLELLKGAQNVTPRSKPPAAPPTGKPRLTVVPDGAQAPGGGAPGGTVHPYAARAVAAELARLDALDRPWHDGARWDATTFEVACCLIEFANSPWSGYSITAAARDLWARAPHDPKWGDAEISAKWESARNTVGSGSRSEPVDALGTGAVCEVPAETFTSALRATEAALAARNDGSEPPAAEPTPGPPINAALDWHALLGGPEPEEEWIAYPYLPVRRMVALYSAPKAGKSLLMLEIAACIAAGRPILGWVPERARTVLYIDFENDPWGDIGPRLRAMGFKAADLDNLAYLSFPNMAKFDTFAGSGDLLRHIAHYGAEVVVIDTVSRTVAGDENDNQTWLSFYNHTGVALKQAGIACIRLDHSGKDGDKGMRGGSAKVGDVDAVWRLDKVTEDVVTLTCTDKRFRLTETEVTLTRQSDPLTHRVGGNPYIVASDARIVAALDALRKSALDPLTTSQREAVSWLMDKVDGPGLTGKNGPLTKAAKAWLGVTDVESQEDL